MPDKRLLIDAQEFASILAVMAKSGNTLSPVIRDAWGHKVLQTLGKTSPDKATGSHISIVGHITDQVAPVHVNGRSQFRLMSVWDHNDRNKGLNRRPGPLLRALQDSADFCRDDNLVLAGDFNNHPRWDRPNGPNNMSEITKQLVDRDLVSLYHHQSGEPFGAESQSTYWYWRRQDKSYHIDYMFVSQAMLRRLVAFEVGSFEDWCLAGRSDHAPLIAEFASPA